MSNWYLIHTKVRHERIAQENLERQGYECFLPQIHIEKLRQSTLQVAQVPLFPRYIFIRLDSSREGQNWAPIRSTVGVSRLVMFGNVPAKIANELVTLIRTQTESSEVRLRHFSAGEAVVVTDGPFAGLEAIYQMKEGEGRVVVLLNILSKPIKMSIAPTCLRKVS